MGIHASYVRSIDEINLRHFIFVSRPNRQSTLRFLISSGLMASLLVFALSCSPVSVKRPSTERMIASVLEEARRSNSGNPLLARAATLEPVDSLQALAAYLKVARTALPGITTDKEAARDYSLSTERAFQLLFETGLDAMDLKTAEGNFQISVDHNSRDLVDPDVLYDVIPSRQLKVSGFRQDATHTGYGSPAVAEQIANPTNQPFIPKYGLTFPVTITLDFPSTNRAVFRIHDSIRSDKAVLGRKLVPLATDYTASLGVLLGKNMQQINGIKATLYPQSSIERVGLYLPDRYDPKKIPVILVHGLLATPDTWRFLVNSVMMDEEIRHNYQFYYFLYPTGIPIPYSALQLRKELNRLQRELNPQSKNPSLDDIVIIGHSMGGLLTSMQVRSGGDKLWNDLFPRPVKESRLPPKYEDLLHDMFYFESAPFIRRAVFANTPHRGSPLADSRIGRLGAWLIRLPTKLPGVVVDVLSLNLEGLGLKAGEIPNGISQLRNRSLLLESLRRRPVPSRIPYHTIIGDRGKNDSPNGSDGIVPYTSAHLQGAASERIVPSDHSGHQHEEGIQEIKRILKLHLKSVR